MHKPFLSIAAIPVLVFLASGCISRSEFQRKTDEAQHFAALSQSLEQDYAKLLEQQKQTALRYDEMAGQLEDARSALTALRNEKLRAKADIERLEGILAERGHETGKAMTELRQAVDRLEEEKRAITEQLQQEKLARQARIAELKTTYDALVGKLENEIRRGEITITDLQGRLTVNLVERILFDSGQAEIKPAGLGVLRRVGSVLKQAAGKTIRVEGHTDNVPISPRLKKIYPSNWELSTARAASVVHFLQESLGIAGERLAVCGFGPYQPAASNATAQGRAQNRRIRIILTTVDENPGKTP
ncbi:OmpA/MotB family protein [Syntrophotalea acetylenica]|uniref:OmpA-like domain-containing protein n=1 Tax=Syntrophotalea acetylenica TaxID=29542 RepID=A0A1L3GJJ8_SYNAC|nr:OmpA family protein [Syntrophotalea acetylenica]APG26094.1 hypothetical protein A7E75_14570 [Syntrophotalea acetylenica]APG44159.1 hypothetical protein A6070_08605 [Syntrophotalea acetylenica]MDY0261165.1 OmpA family protein [Syntrophotalea acetylenica]